MRRNKRLDLFAASIEAGSLVRITWIDADQGLGAWCTPEEALSQPPTTVVTVGNIVGVRHGLLVIAGDTDGTNIHQVGRIPTAWLVSIQVIEPPIVHDRNA